MSTILERVRAIREAALSGQMASQMAGGLLGQSTGGTIRGTVAQRMATVLKVPAPSAQSQLPIIDVVHDKVSAFVSKSPLVTGARPGVVGIMPVTGAAPSTQMSKQVLPPPKNVKFV